MLSKFVVATNSLNEYWLVFINILDLFQEYLSTHNKIPRTSNKLIIR